MGKWTLWLKIVGIAAATYAVGGLFFLAWVHSEPYEEWKIGVVCATGLRPYPLSVFMLYDNGTHTITMNSCGWIANEEFTSYLKERDMISKMPCPELAERHDSEKPYHNGQNRALAGFRVLICEFIQDLESQKGAVERPR